MNSQEFIEAIPLGGLGEFGMNMMVFRYGTQMIVVDSGLMFPDEELLGIDVIVPDISFLIDNASQVKAIVLTHGHEDHIGALPFVFPALSHVPIYGTRYTLGLASAKLAEHRLLDQAELNTVEAGQTHQMGDFQVEFIHVTHSIVDAVMLAITTPAGVILHTGDFKIDSSPPGWPGHRPSPNCRVRPPGRAGSVLRQHQRGSAGDHPLGNRRDRKAGRDLSPRSGQGDRFLFHLLHPSYSDRVQPGPALWAQGGHRRTEHAVDDQGRPPARLPEHSGRTAGQDTGRQEDAAGTRSLDSDGLSRATVGRPAPDGRGQLQEHENRSERHRGDFGTHHSRQRKDHFPHGQPSLQEGCGRPLRRRIPTSHSCFRPRQFRGAQAFAEPGAPQAFRAHPWRLPPALPPRGIGQKSACGGRQGSHRGDRRPYSAEPTGGRAQRQGSGGPHLYR